MIWKRRLDLKEVNIEADRRHVIGTDHALLHCDLYTGTRLWTRWGNDSRPRYMMKELPPEVVVDVDDLSRMARDNAQDQGLGTPTRTRMKLRSPFELHVALTALRIGKLFIDSDDKLNDDGKQIA